MTIEVQAPDGSVVEFPDGTDGATIHGAMLQHFGSGQGDKSPQAEKGLWQRLSEGEFPTLYNPKTANLLPGRTGKPPQMRGLDLPTFAEGMSEAPGVTLAGAAAPLAAALPAEGASVSIGAAAKAWGALPAWLKTGVVGGSIGLSADAARKAGAPDALIHWLENMELVRQFGKHS